MTLPLLASLRLTLALITPGAAPPEQGAALDHAAVLAKLDPAFVQVEFTLKYDQGDEPSCDGWMTRCPNCGELHVSGTSGSVEQQRPVEATGLLVDARTVITADPLIHPRFVERIAVRAAGQRAEARVAAYVLGEPALLLELTSPLDGARPLAFAAAAGRPALCASRERVGGLWTASLRPYTPQLLTDELGRRYSLAPAFAVILDETGRPAGLSVSGHLPVDDSWRGSPVSWAAWSASEMTAALQRLQARCESSLFHITLLFRSPKSNDEPYGRYFEAFDRDQQTPTRHDAVGVMLDDQRVVVLEALAPKDTARLEQILVNVPGGAPLAAQFECSLRDYGCLVARTERPLAGAELTWSSAPITAHAANLLLAAEILVAGERRIARFMHQRLADFEPSWTGRLYPALSGGGEHLFLFTRAGELVALPVVRRLNVSLREHWSSGRAELTPAEVLLEALRDLPSHADPGNRPLPPEEEDRLAWMGVELQALNPDLARVHGVSHQTRNGETGAVVSHVYPGSPAESSGVQPGWILLRLHVDGEPRPVELRLEPDDYQEFGGVPWENLDEIPTEYLAELPAPWPAAENALSRALTDLGIGRHYRAEFVADKETVLRDFEVAQAPLSYEGAARYASAALGLTVRNLTYEVRRFLRWADDQPGVIISRIEGGQPAAVAGLKPYEIITQVNDQPLHDVQAFEKMAGASPELRFVVSRMGRERVVKIEGPQPGDGD
jgi:hypothetical protein